MHLRIGKLLKNSFSKPIVIIVKISLKLLIIDIYLDIWFIDKPIGERLLGLRES